MCGQHWMKSEGRDDDGVKEGNDDGLADKEQKGVCLCNTVRFIDLEVHYKIYVKACFVPIFGRFI